MIFVIVGPTGIGKSSLSELYAKKHDAFIVNGDAFQCYKEMNIGTAKPPIASRNETTHFLFDIRSIEQGYTIFDYQQDLRQVLNRLLEKQKDIIIVGGSGLYLKSALYDFELSIPQQNYDMSRFNDLSDEELHHHLEEIDYEESQKIHFKNRKRVLRAIQIYYESGETKSALLSKQEHKLLYPVTFVGLELENRENLYELINQRVDQMLEEGLLEEVKELYEKYGDSLRAFQAIGYKEIMEYYRGDISLQDAISKVKKNTRNYAKRQYTYFKNQLPINWFKSKEEALEFMEKIKENKKCSY